MKDIQVNKKGRDKPSTFSKKPNHINENQCVQFVTGQKDYVYVSGQIGLNPPPVIARDKRETVYSHVDFCVADFLFLLFSTFELVGSL